MLSLNFAPTGGVGLDPDSNRLDPGHVGAASIGSPRILRLWIAGQLGKGISTFKQSFRLLEY